MHSIRISRLSPDNSKPRKLVAGTASRRHRTARPQCKTVNGWVRSKSDGFGALPTWLRNVSAPLSFYAENSFCLSQESGVRYTRIKKRDQDLEDA